MKKFKGNKIVILLFAAVIVALAVFAILKSRSSDNKKRKLFQRQRQKRLKYPMILLSRITRPRKSKIQRNCRKR